METLTVTEVHVDEDHSTEVSSERITWTAQDGREIDIKELTESHIVNLYRWLLQVGLPRTRQIIYGELERRATGSYPGNWEMMITVYKKHSETWRLKIYSDEKG